MEHKISVFRKEHFNAAHRLHNPAWSEEKNEETFGKCNNPHFHGHNYELEIRIVGYVDQETGYLIDLKKLSDLINLNVLEKFDHKNLNLDTAEFKDLNPTVENIAIVIFNILRGKIEKNLDLQVKLYETDRNFVEYPAFLNI